MKVKGFLCSMKLARRYDGAVDSFGDDGGGVSRSIRPGG